MRRRPQRDVHLLALALDKAFVDSDGEAVRSLLRPPPGDQEHGDLRVPHHPVRDAAEPRPPESAATVRRHRDEIAGTLRGGREDLDVGDARPHLRRDACAAFAQLAPARDWLQPIAAAPIACGAGALTTSRPDSRRTARRPVLTSRVWALPKRGSDSTFTLPGNVHVGTLCSPRPRSGSG